MRAKRALIAVLGFCGAVVVGTSSKADVPPPDGYVEECIIEKTCPTGKECLVCPGSYEDYYNAPFCQQSYANQGFTKECTTWGGSFWEEIWCRPVDDSRSDDAGSSETDAGQQAQLVQCPEVTPHAPSSKGSCSVRIIRSDKDDAIGLGFITSIILFMVIRIRRRR